MRVKDKGDLYVHQGASRCHRDARERATIGKADKDARVRRTPRPEGASVRRVTGGANWNVIMLSDLGGSMVERYQYRPYGEVTVYQYTSYGGRDGDGDVDSTDKGTVGTTCTGTVTGACRILDLDFDGDYDSADTSKFDALTQGTAYHPGRVATGVEQPFAHQGLLFDAEAGSYQNRARQLEHPVDVFGPGTAGKIFLRPRVAIFTRCIDVDIQERVKWLGLQLANTWNQRDYAPSGYLGLVRDGSYRCNTFHFSPIVGTTSTMGSPHVTYELMSNDVQLGGCGSELGVTKNTNPPRGCLQRDPLQYYNPYFVVAPHEVGHVVTGFDEVDPLVDFSGHCNDSPNGDHLMAAGNELSYRGSRWLAGHTLKATVNHQIENVTRYEAQPWRECYPW